MSSTPTYEFIRTLMAMIGKEGGTLDLGPPPQVKTGVGGFTTVRLAPGLNLDQDIAAFDIFTGVWWPIRQKSPQAPRRKVAWLVMKLIAAYPILHRKDQFLFIQLGIRERKLKEDDRDRFRRRINQILTAHLDQLEPHLHWAIGQIKELSPNPSLDWVELTDDLSIWDQGYRYYQETIKIPREYLDILGATSHYYDVRQKWASQYLSGLKQGQTLTQGG